MQTSPHGIGELIVRLDQEFINEYGDTFIDQSTGDIETTFINQAVTNIINDEVVTVGKQPVQNQSINYPLQSIAASDFLQTHTVVPADSTLVLRGFYISDSTGAEPGSAGDFEYEMFDVDSATVFHTSTGNVGTGNALAYRNYTTQGRVRHRVTNTGTSSTDASLYVAYDIIPIVEASITYSVYEYDEANSEPGEKQQDVSTTRKQAYYGDRINKILLEFQDEQWLDNFTFDGVVFEDWEEGTSREADYNNVGVDGVSVSDVDPIEGGWSLHTTGEFVKEVDGPTDGYSQYYANPTEITWLQRCSSNPELQFDLFDNNIRFVCDQGVDLMVIDNIGDDSENSSMPELPESLYHEVTIDYT